MAAFVRQRFFRHMAGPKFASAPWKQHSRILHSEAAESNLMDYHYHSVSESLTDPKGKKHLELLKEAYAERLEAYAERLDSYKKQLDFNKEQLDFNKKQSEAIINQSESLINQSDVTKAHIDSLNVKILELKGITNLRGLFEYMFELLAASAKTQRKGEQGWVDILITNGALSACIANCTNIKGVPKQAAKVQYLYSQVSQHIHAGKAIAELQSSGDRVYFHRGPLTPEDVGIVLCMGKVLKLPLMEESGSRMAFAGV